MLLVLLIKCIKAMRALKLDLVLDYVLLDGSGFWLFPKNDITMALPLF